MAIKRRTEYAPANYDDFLNQLTNAHQEQKSCCFYFSDSNQISGRILFKEGEIDFVSCDGQNATNAITLICELQQSTNLIYRIGRFLPMLRDKRLPDTPSILEKLGSAAQPNFSSKSKQITSSQSVSQTSTLTEDDKKIIETALLELMGPMANLFMKDYVLNASSKEEAFSNMCKELSEPDAAKIKEQLF